MNRQIVARSVVGTLCWGALTATSGCILSAPEQTEKEHPVRISGVIEGDGADNAQLSVEIKLCTEESGGDCGEAKRCKSKPGIVCSNRILRSAWMN